MSIIDTSMKTQSRLTVSWGPGKTNLGKMEVIARGFKVSFWGDVNVVKSVVWMVRQL
jgi:hypothetical protein